MFTLKWKSIPQNQSCIQAIKEVLILHVLFVKLFWGTETRFVPLHPSIAVELISTLLVKKSVCTYMIVLVYRSIVAQLCETFLRG